jgi:hypothetical protein
VIWVIWSDVLLVLFILPVLRIEPLSFSVSFELNPAALQILYLFMEQYLGPITVQDKYENRFD